MQVSGLSVDLASEKCRTTELQKALEQIQESQRKLQSDLYGKESEVSALHQDLKVRVPRKGRTSALFMAWFQSLWPDLRDEFDYQYKFLLVPLNIILF